jgi:hypothetical protein
MKMNSKKADAVEEKFAEAICRAFNDVSHDVNDTGPAVVALIQVLATFLSIQTDDAHGATEAAIALLREAVNERLQALIASGIRPDQEKLEGKDQPR